MTGLAEPLLRNESRPIRRTEVYMKRPRTHGGAPRVFRLTQLWPRLKMSPVRLAENAITIKERERTEPLFLCS